MEVPRALPVGLHYSWPFLLLVQCRPMYIPAGRSLRFVSLPYLAGIVTIGAACAPPVSVSENRNIKKLNICFDCLSRSSIQNRWLR